jgi:hypothetical protein
VSSTNHDLLAKVEDLATRLRAIQSDLADEAPELRREQLEDEIGRALQGVVAHGRAEFLELLAARFPSWDNDVSRGGAAAPATGGTRSATDQKEWSDPSFVLKRLIDLCKDLPEEKKLAVRRTLEEAGLSSGGVGSWPEAPLQRLRGLCAGGPKGQPNSGRALEALSMLLEFTLRLDKVVWATWQQMAPRSSVKRRGQLQRALGHWLDGGADVSQNEIQQELEDLRQLSAAVIASVSQAGHLAYVRLQNLQPDAVMAAAKDEGKRAWEAWEVAYWKKYLQLCQSLDPNSFEVEMMHAMADYVLPLLGRGRT